MMSFLCLKKSGASEAWATQPSVAGPLRRNVVMVTIRRKPQSVFLRSEF